MTVEWDGEGGGGPNRNGGTEGGPANGSPSEAATADEKGSGSGADTAPAAAEEGVGGQWSPRGGVESGVDVGPAAAEEGIGGQRSPREGTESGSGRNVAAGGLSLEESIDGVEVGGQRSSGGEAVSGSGGPAAAGGLSLEEAIHEVEAEEHEYRPPAAGTLSNIITALAVVALGVAALLGASALGVGSASEPGPGTWPLLISIALVVLGVVLLLGARRSSDAEKFSRSAWLVLAGLATMVVFVLVIEVIGFEIPAALLCLVWLRFLGRESWRMSVVTSLAVVAGFYLVFVAALAVPIPHLF